MSHQFSAKDYNDRRFGGTPMKKIPLLVASLACLTAVSCGQSSSGGSNSIKGEEKVKTVDKATWEKLITNAGLITPPTNFTLHFSDEGGQKGTIKFDYIEIELAVSYTDGDPIPTLYYCIMEDRADIYVMDIQTGRLDDIEHVARDVAMSQLTSAVGLVGAPFTYDKFAFKSDKGSYHSDLVAMPDGFDFHDVDFYFEDNLFVKATAKRDTSDPSSSIAVTLTADSYGTTEVKMPSYYS